MTITVHLPDDLAARLAAVAARRGVGVDQIAAELVSAGLIDTEPAGQAQQQRPRRRLSFAGVGASTTGRGAAQVDELLAEGFGRDWMLIVDTGPLLATADRNDPAHGSCRALLENETQPLVTTALVIAEAAYLMCRQLGPVAETALYTAISNQELLVENLIQSDWERVGELVTTYASLPLGGTAHRHPRPPSLHGRAPCTHRRVQPHTLIGPAARHEP